MQIAYNTISDLFVVIIGAKVVNYFMPRKFSFEFSHYNTSCFIEHNGKFVYINHSSTLARMDSGVELNLIRS